MKGLVVVNRAICLSLGSMFIRFVSRYHHLLSLESYGFKVSILAVGF